MLDQIVINMKSRGPPHNSRKRPNGHAIRSPKLLLNKIINDTRGHGSINGMPDGQKLKNKMTTTKSAKINVARSVGFRIAYAYVPTLIDPSGKITTPHIPDPNNNAIRYFKSFGKVKTLSVSKKGRLA